MEQIMAQYEFVIVVILRIVEQDTSMEHILKHQMPYLSWTEVSAIINIIFSDPLKICLIFDGADEMLLKSSFSASIKEIMSLRKAENCLCITTTRPHVVDEMRDWGPGTVQQQVKLEGFNKSQIEEYVRLFFEDRGKAKAMLESLDLTESSAEYELCRIPIRLEIMCTVWGRYASFGTRLIDVYNKFLMILLHHMEDKGEKSKKITEDSLLEKYKHSHLLPTGRLASLHDKKGKPVTTYTPASATSEEWKNILDLGCIVKIYPTTDFCEALWGFTHMTLREYFLAFYIAFIEDEADIADYLRSCKSLKCINKHLVATKCLCGMNSDRANKVIRNVVEKTKGETQCLKLFCLLSSLVSNFNDKDDVTFPLPKEVCLKREYCDMSKNDESEPHFYYKSVDLQNKTAMEKHIETLFEVDSFDSNQNMKHLCIHDYSLLPSGAEQKLNYIKEVCTDIQCQSDLERAGSIFKYMENVTTFYMDFRNTSINVDYNYQNWPMRHEDTSGNIIAFIIKGCKILKACRKFLGRLPTMKTFRIVETGHVPEDISSFLKAISKEKVENMEMHFITGNNSQSSMEALTSEIGKIQNDCVSEIMISDTSNYGKDFAKRNAHFPLQFLVKMQANFKNLQTLRLRNSVFVKCITANVLVRNISSNSVKELDLLDNRWEDCKVCIPLLMSQTPNLKILFVDSNVVSHLQLEDNRLQTLLIKGPLPCEYDLWKDSFHIFLNLDELFLIVTGKFGNIENVINASSNLQNLKTLLIWTEKAIFTDAMKRRTLRKNTPVLEELYIHCQETVKGNDLISFAASLPPSLTHLNMEQCLVHKAEDNFKSELTIKLPKLKRLNINMEEDYLYSTNNGNDSSNTDLVIYHDDEECLRKIGSSSYKSSHGSDMLIRMHGRDIVTVQED